MIDILMVMVFGGMVVGSIMLFGIACALERLDTSVKTKVSVKEECYKLNQVAEMDAETDAMMVALLDAKYLRERRYLCMLRQVDKGPVYYQTWVIGPVLGPVKLS